MAANQMHLWFEIDTSETTLSPNKEIEAIFNLFSIKDNLPFSDNFVCNMCTDSKGRVTSVSATHCLLEGIEIWNSCYNSLGISVRMLRKGSLLADSSSSSSLFSRQVSSSSSGSAPSSSSSTMAGNGNNNSHNNRNSRRASSGSVGGSSVKQWAATAEGSHRRPFAGGFCPLPKEPSWTQPTKAVCQLHVMGFKKTNDENLWHVICVEAEKNKKKFVPLGNIKLNITVIKCDKKQLPTQFPNFSIATICKPQPLVSAMTPVDKAQFFMTLKHGRFSQGDKRSAKNVEVRVTLRDNEGTHEQNCFVVGPSPNNSNFYNNNHNNDGGNNHSNGNNGGGGYNHGVLLMSEYRSPVIYHANDPKWEDQVHIIFPLAKIAHLHLHFELYHVPRSSQSQRKVAYPFAFAFLHLVDNQHAMSLDENNLQLWRPKYPTPNNPIFYLMGDYEGKLAEDENLSVYLRSVHPYIFSQGFHQIPRLGADCSVSLSLDSFQWRGICKQWLPTRICVAGQTDRSQPFGENVNGGKSSVVSGDSHQRMSGSYLSTTRTLLGFVKSDMFLAFEMDSSLWDMSLRSANSSSSLDNIRLPHTPLWNIFLEDATILRMETGRHNKIGLFSWAFAFVIELPTREQMEICYCALREARVGVLKAKLRALGVDLSKIQPGATEPTSSNAPNSRGAERYSQAIPDRPLGLDPRETENLQNRFRAAKNALENIRAKQVSVAQVIAKLNAQIAQLQAQ